MKKTNSKINAPADIPFYPAALTIAGSDSGGGAGIQADLRTFSAHGVFGCSAIAALTAQNPHGVTGIFPSSPEFLTLQIRAVLEDFSIGAVKTGMLFSKALISAAAAELRKYPCPIVVDPVMIATSGARLLKEDAAETLMSDLLPLAAWVTPNIPEAEVLAEMKILSTADLTTAAERCSIRYGCGTVVKGGHGTGNKSCDAVCPGPGKRVFLLEAERLAVPETAPHGTGCTFSSALAADLALGMTPEEAVREAKNFVFESLLHPVRTGEKVYSMFPGRFRR